MVLCSTSHSCDCILLKAVETITASISKQLVRALHLNRSDLA
jgi:hypothetical protein